MCSFFSLQMDRLDPMQNQMCRVCDEPAAGFHFGAFTCEGCKSFFGRTCNNQSVIQECKNNYRCVINKKNRTACKACRLRKCLMVGMSKSGSRYGRRSNWFKIHCLMQQASGGGSGGGGSNPGSGTTRTPEPPQNHHHHQQPPVVVPPVPPRSTTNNLASPPLWRPLDSPSPKASPPPVSAAAPPVTAMPKTSVFSFLPQAVAQAQAAAVQAASQQSAHSLKTKESIDSTSPRSTPITPPASTAPISSPPTTGLHPFTFPGSLYSMPFGNALPFLPPTFNIPGLSGLPLHKQALLSPLLASSHFLAAARKAYPFGLSAAPPQPASTPPPAETSTTDVLAEHKALLERFRASAAAMAAAAALNNNKEDDEKSASPPMASEVMTSSARPPVKLSTHTAMDLTSKRQSGSEADSVSSVGSEIIPHLSDTDEEPIEADIADEVNASKNQQPRKESESSSMPLDLTCV